MRELRRKVLLPVFQLSELTTADDPQAIRRVVKQGKGQPPFTYYYRLKWDSLAERGFNYNLFPIVLDRNGAPWALGTIYILAQLEADPTPIMTTYQSIGEDLGAYKEWVDDQERPSEVMFHFPRIKLRRPTYRYSGFLQQKIQAGEIALATACRGIGTVVAIYRWLIDNDYFEPEYPPWEEKNYRVCFSTDEGRTLSKKVVSTDVSIHASKAEDPFDGTIRDGGKLRPLNGKEQDLILEFTLSIGNAECYLIQLFVLATGARIQTVCTLRLRYFLHPNPPYAKALSGDGEVFKLKAGPGTGIDTKKNKNGVLQIPRSVYELLHIYALSKRAEKRRSRFVARHGEPLDHYLFLTQQGNPYYTAKSDVLRFKPNLDRRHEKAGQSVRQFLKDHVVPYVRKHHNKLFYYRPHDLRASFGMNMTEQLMTQVQKGKLTLSRARMIVKELLWHESFATTDRYLNYRSQMDSIYEAVNGYGEQLQTWVNQAMKGGELEDE